ncbi:MAG: T9SS type A sorting domain-containing protein [Bacteroidota bacterium]|nr:T9SS type A sorting domain-containing protein [Bacteroidota bacterium]
MVPTRNGEFLISGNQTSGTVNAIVTPATSFLVRLDSLGNIRWTRDFTFSGQPAAGRLIGLPGDGSITVGAIVRQVSGPIFASVAVATQFDSLGRVGWQRIIGRSYSSINQLATLPDGTYVLAGSEERVMPGTNTVRADAWLLRLTASGDTLGGRYFGTAAQFDEWRDVRATPHNGLLLTGIVGTGGTQEQGWLMQLDNLGRVQWQQRVPATFGASTPSYLFFHGRPLQNGDVLVSGYRLVPGSASTPQDAYQAVYRPNATGGATAVWERITPLSANEPFTGSLDLSAAGELTITGYANNASGTIPPQSLSHLRLQLTERPYVPNLCQTPPQALLGFALTTGGDSLRFISLSSPGPAYAELLRWRWDFGDGTRYDGPAPPPHRYAPGSPAATAVHLTITNNLGCTSTTVVYPLALATAAARALQARLEVFPNPATGHATVRLPGLPPQPAVAAELRNTLGQTVRTLRWPATALAQGQPLDLAGLPPGVYVLHLHPREGALVKRVVVN